MVWNLFLAAIPLALSFVLFRRARHLGVAWWVTFGAWLVFLPNAPYVLTDVVHMRGDLRASPSHAYTLAVLLTYALYAAAGLISYVASLQLLRNFLHRVAPRRCVLPVLAAVHALSVIAMYLGRVVRLNSWDVVVAPRSVVSVLHMPHPHTVALLAGMFVVVGIGAYVVGAVGDKTIAVLRSNS